MIRTFIDNIEVDNPTNISSVEIELQYDKRGNANITTDGDLEFGTGDLSRKTDAYTYLKNKIDNGAILNGIPIRIYTYEFEREIDIIVGYLDLWGATIDEDNRKILCQFIDGRGVNNLLENLNSVSFEYLRSIGKIKDNDIILSPVVIESTTNVWATGISIITLSILILTITREVASLIELLQNSAGLDPWVFAMQAITRIVYLVALLFTIGKIIIDMFNSIIQPIKYVSGMTVLRHFEIGFEHFGYRFESKIFEGAEKTLTLFPERYSTPKNKSLSDISGWITPNKSKMGGWYKGYFGDFCDTFLQYYNCSFKVDYQNKIVRMVSANDIYSTSSYNMPSMERRYTFNKDDYTANFTVEFTTDVNDKNTINEYIGTRSSIFLDTGQKSASHSLAKGGKTITLPFSIFKSKASLNEAEKVFEKITKVVGAIINTLIDVINLIIDVMNGITSVINKIIKALAIIGIKIKFQIGKIPSVPKSNIQNLISDRVGCFIMENDIISVPKLAYVKNANNPLKNRKSAELTADYILETYHSSTMFSRGHQFRLLEETVSLPMTFTDFDSCLRNNILQNGEILETVKWNPFERTAKIKSKIRYIYVKNIKEVKTIEDGK